MATAVRNRQMEPVRPAWSGSQAYSLAVLCLVLGVAVGYLVRGSATEPAVGAAAPNVSVGQMQMPGMGGMPGGVNTAELVEEQARLLLTALKTNPKDTTTLAKIGNLYYDAQIYPKAVEYYSEVLKITPANADVRTDMGTAYFYMGQADRAITEFQKSLSYRPNHGPTLFNLGIVKWQGKNDAQGAVAAWEQLLKANPSYPEKQNVLDLISRAKQHAKT